jgi:hypothetical protein
MRVVRINTTAYQEEDFYLLTTLDDSQIAEVIQPIINSSKFWDIETLHEAFKKEFPNKIVDFIAEIDTLKF